MYETSLPPADPPPPAPNPPSTNLNQHSTDILAPTHHPDPRGCLINRDLSNSTHHLLTNPMSYHTNTPPQTNLVSKRESQSAMDSLSVVPSISDSVVHVKCFPRVFGLHNDSQLPVRIKKPLSLINGGANICLTNNLSLLVDAIDIQLLPITVALNNTVTLNNCCTKQGFIPLTLTDGSIHWQICYYCANAAETIISPQAILASSNVFSLWTMTSFKDGSPGFICFDRHDGLLKMSLSLDCNNGLYYCPTNVFTTNTFPVHLHQCWALPSKTEDAASSKPLAPSVLHAQVDAAATPRNRQ
jgi:hypothetical protein